MKSEILGGERKYAVYLPPGFETSIRSYPVLYLLHGSGDDQTGWVQLQFDKELEAASACCSAPNSTRDFQMFAT